MKRRTYTKEYKTAAVELVLKGGRSVAEAARSLGIHENLLRSWAKLLEAEGGDAFRGQGNRTALEEENRRLRLEVQRLKMEQEFLKKASAYFAKHLK